MPADEQGGPLSVWGRGSVDAVQGDESLEHGRVCSPQDTQPFGVLVVARGDSPCEVDDDGPVLRLEAADANADEQTAFTEDVKGGQLLGELDGMTT